MTFPQRSLLDALEPIDPRTQVERVPGIDAVCEAGLTESTCRWPYCPCKFPDRTVPKEDT